MILEAKSIVFFESKNASIFIWFCIAIPKSTPKHFLAKIAMMRDILNKINARNVTK